MTDVAQTSSDREAESSDDNDDDEVDSSIIGSSPYL